MNGTIANSVRIGKHIIQGVQDDRITFLAASIAFYAILSIFPLLLLVLAIGSVFLGDAFAQTLIGQLSNFITPEAEQILEEALLGETGQVGASVVGIAFLLWSAIRVFRGLDIAFSQIYAESPDPGFLTTVRNGLLAFITIGAAVIALFIIRGYLRFVDLPPYVLYLSPVLVFLTIAIVFAPMYYIFPNISPSLRTIIPGTLFAALGWTLLGELFGIYAANAGTYALFGVIGGILLILVWFYFGAIIILLGAVINAVLAEKYRPVETDEDTPVIGDGG